jgi:hypothetical protein
MIGIVLDSFLMLLLVAALGYGVRLEKKLTALRAGQLAFAGAVTELNAAAGRAENALRSLRASAEEADMLHDRILKARAVKQELEVLIARQSRSAPAVSAPVAAPPIDLGPLRTPEPEIKRPAFAALPDDEDRALRMAALAERIQGMAAPRTPAAPATAPTATNPARDNVSAILSALTANHSAQQSLNKARRSLDDDLFAA